MGGIFIVTIALGLVAACVVGILKLPKTPGGLVLKIVLGIVLGIILFWLVWLAVMVFFVGPSMRNK